MDSLAELLLGKGKRVLQREQEEEERRTKQRYVTNLFQNGTRLVNNFSDRKVLFGRHFNLEELKEFKLDQIFGRIGWDSMLNMKCALYPRLIKMFYCNLKHETYPDIKITSLVEGVKITLDRETLAEILEIPFEGPQVYVYTSWPIVDDFDVLETLKLVCGNENITKRYNPDAKDLRLIARLLHRVITAVFLPREEHRDVVTHMDMFLLDRIMRGKKVDLCYIILKNMVQAHSLDNYPLPYGQLLTMIFEHFKIYPDDKDKRWLKGGHILNLSIVRTMGYERNAKGNWVKVDSRMRKRRGCHGDEENERQEEVLSCTFEEVRNEGQVAPVQGSLHTVEEEKNELRSLLNRHSGLAYEKQKNKGQAAPGKGSLHTVEEKRNELRSLLKIRSRLAYEKERNEGQAAPGQGSLRTAEEKRNELRSLLKIRSSLDYGEERNEGQTAPRQGFMAQHGEVTHASRQGFMATIKEERNEEQAVPRQDSVAICEEERNEEQAAPRQDFMGTNEEERNEGQGALILGNGKEINEAQLAPWKDSMGSYEEEISQGQVAPWKDSMGSYEEEVNEGQVAPWKDSMGSYEEEVNEGQAAPGFGNEEERTEGQTAPGLSNGEQRNGQTAHRLSNGKERSEGQAAPRFSHGEERNKGQAAPRLDNGEVRNEGQTAPMQDSIDTIGEALQRINARIDSIAISLDTYRIQQVKANETLQIEQEKAIKTLQIQHEKAIEALQIQQAEVIETLQNQQAEATQAINLRLEYIMDFLNERVPPRDD